MEKICLARRRIGGIHLQGVERPREQTQTGEKVVSVGLTADQCRRLRLPEGLTASEGVPDSVSLELRRNGNGPIVFNFHFRRGDTIRMLKPEHVCQMLQVGKGVLAGLILSGDLKCYRIGRMRRFLLRDILEFLAASAASGEGDQASKPDAGAPTRLKTGNDRMALRPQQTQAGS